MGKKLILIIFIVGIWGVLAFAVLDFTRDEDIDLVKPLAEIVDIPKIGGTGREKLKSNSVFADSDILNVLLVGIDTSENRRGKGQIGFNTDTMILVSINPETNRILLTSVPRDLWINGNKINALYTAYGEGTLVDAFEKVTGQKVDGVIRADFDHFEWLVDSMGGVPVSVERTFTDTSFPNRTDSGAMTVTFSAGEELMSGERALIFARSRKGNNGEGSDLMRARRQHLILSSMIDAISQPESIFWPMDVEKAFGIVTAPSKVYTTLTLSDVKYLWDFYNDKDEYVVESFVVDDQYVYHPGMYPESEFHAWVFIAREPGFTNLHQDILDKLNGVFASAEAESKIIRGIENIATETQDSETQDTENVAGESSEVSQEGHSQSAESEISAVENSGT